MIGRFPPLERCPGNGCESLIDPTRKLCSHCLQAKGKRKAKGAKT
jgi:hypothetical protein